MKRRKKLPYVIIILACIFLLIPFAATLVYSFTIGWTKLFDQYPSDSDLQHRCNSGSVYFSGLLSKT